MIKFIVSVSVMCTLISCADKSTNSSSTESSEGVLSSSNLLGSSALPSSSTTVQHSSAQVSSSIASSSAIAVVAGTTDIEGVIYPTVQIGTQTWLAKNLNVETDSGSHCYDEVASNCDTYGRLYDWATAITVCPTGWTLPSDEEYTTLMTNVDALNGTKEVGTSLKTKTGWTFLQGVTNSDDYGFAALPGGYSTSSFGHDLGNLGSWWTSTEMSSETGRSLNMNYGHNYAEIGSVTKSYYLSVRCVK